jgi:hypothetical protein
VKHEGTEKAIRTAKQGAQTIYSVFGRYIEDYIKNLTCWKKSKNRFGLNAPKLIFSFDQILLGIVISSKKYKYLMAKIRT